MKVIHNFTAFALVILGGVTSANAYDGKRTKFYIGADVTQVTGSIEGKNFFTSEEKDLSTWGFTAGYELNKVFSIDAFYSEEMDVDLKNYGLRLNARPVVYGPIYAVGTLGLNQSKFVGKGEPLTNDPFAPDYDSKGNSNYERVNDRTGVDPLFAVGLGYRYQSVDFEVKYIDYADYNGVMGSLMVRF